MPRSKPRPVIVKYNNDIDKEKAKAYLQLLNRRFTVNELH